MYHVWFYVLFGVLYRCPKLCISYRSTTWWCSLLTGLMWRMPAECRSMRTSSQRRSRNFTTSTPLALRSVSMPTRKDQHKAWPCHSGLSPSLFLFCLSICLSTIPSQGRRMAPRALATADVTGASYDNVVWRWCQTKPLQSRTALQMKIALKILSWMCSWQLFYFVSH